MTAGLPYVHRVTKYDPADRDERDCYTGPEDTDCDHGPVEAAYLAAVAAFAEEAGITELTVRDPEYHGGVELGEQQPAEEAGMAALFRPDLTGFHDGATVPLPVALEMVRVMLRESGGWCLLESEGRFFVHVGYDQYSYVGSAVPVDRAVDRTAALGLFAERVTASPYEPEPPAGPPPRAADDAFWAEVAGLAASRGAVLLQEVQVGNSARWHRLRAADVPGVHARLTPRAVLHVRPDLSADVPGVLAAALAEEYAELVWQDGGSRILAARFDERDHGLLPGVLAGARAACLPGYGPDAAEPLLSAVLPDADGVVRVRRPF
ncbi:RNA-binding protein [Kitasatospora herbaricolor]|uniref:RNA-binding protein n=1 Tax=Kitasatospora herbaricolor TaxID=68217 RepID=UPI0036D9656B